MRRYVIYVDQIEIRRLLVWFCGQRVWMLDTRCVGGFVADVTFGGRHAGLYICHVVGGTLGK